MNMDFKNVQRRVYDALNVLSALGIINKDRNKIHYKGILKKDGNPLDTSKLTTNLDGNESFQIKQTESNNEQINEIL